jgi:glycosyltransferase involved in cell wall biosynthesis
MTPKNWKIVYVSASASGYGAENALYDLVTHLPPQFSPFVLLPEEGPLVKKLQDAGIAHRVIPYAVLNRFYLHPIRIVALFVGIIRSTIRLVKVFHELQPDLIHTNNILVLPSAFAAAIVRVPHVWHIREIIQRHHLPNFLWTLWRWTIERLSTRIICISSAVQSQFPSSNKTVVIHDGIDVRQFRPASIEKSQGDNDLIKIGMIGRVDPRRKGQHDFLNAASMVLQKGKPARFYVFGDERSEMKKQERSPAEIGKAYEDVQEIEFLGFVPREHLAERIRDLDIVVLYSKKPEGLGIVLLEAMASGKVVVAPNEGGPLDIIQSSINGILVEPRNASALAEAMLQLIEKKDLRLKLGSAARIRIEEQFTLPLHVSKVAELYRELLSTS